MMARRMCDARRSRDIRAELRSVELEIAALPETPAAGNALIGRRSIKHRLGLAYWPSERDSGRYTVHRLRCNVGECPGSIELGDLERRLLPAGLAPNDRRRERLRVLRDWYRGWLSGEAQ